jgi:hypothetical protein
MAKRAMVGTAIIVAWLAGIGLLIRREYFRPQYERLAEAAMRVTPGAVYYGVMQGARQIGFASSTIDTAQTSITVNDYFVADLPIGGKPRRATARTNVVLSRALRMKEFDLSLDTEGAPIRATGKVDGDSVLILTIQSGTEEGKPQRIALTGPILLPTLVPLALALGETPKVGKRYVLPVFDPSTMAPREVGLNVRAESAFVLNDSSVYDSTTKRWRGIQPDTVKAWQVSAETSGGFAGWVDEQGRIVQTTQLGLDLKRLPYEVAFENWRADSTNLAVTDDRDILETTAIAANKRIDRRIESMRVRLTGVDLSGFDLQGQRQSLNGDVLTIAPIDRGAMTPSWTLPKKPNVDAKYLAAEPLIESNDHDLWYAAYNVQHFEHDPAKVAMQLNAWVNYAVKDRVTFGVPDALEVFRTRVGDCNEHTQLYVAMARAIGIPARIAAGLAYVDGKFYYHAWPEVFLGDWVGVDPTFGQFPADAAHLRFTIGGLGRQTELLRLMGNLKIEVLDVNDAPAKRSSTPP